MKKKLLTPPSDDEIFEELCLDLWREIWLDPDASKYGRKGQEQHGIDLVSTPGIGSTRRAVQCKVRKKDLREEAIRKDCESAKELDPKIEELIFATSLENDKKLIDIISNIDIEHQKKGFFRVRIKFWDDLDGLIRKNVNTYCKYYRDEIIQSVQLLAKKARFTSNTVYDENLELFTPLVSNLAKTFINSGHITLGEISTVDIGVQSSSSNAKLLDAIKEYLNNDKLTLAVNKLDEYKEIHLEKSTDAEKFRYYYYRGSICNELNEQLECSKYFLKAYNSNPEHQSAYKLKALALLINGDKIQASEYALKAIELDPCNEISYQVLAQTEPNKSPEEIIKCIPENKRDEPELAFTISEVYRRKGELPQAIKWLETALVKAENSYKIKIHLVQALFEYSFKRCELSFFGLRDKNAEALIRRAISLLSEVLLYIQSDNQLYRAKAYLLVNKANAHRLLGEYDQAEREFEHYLQMGGEESDEVLRLRALLAIETGKYNIAEILMKSISEKELYIETKLLLAESLRFQKRYDEALSVLNDSPGTGGAIIQAEVDRLRVQLLLDKKETQAALNLVECLLLIKRTICSLIDKARVLEALGNNQTALITLKEAEKLFSDETTDKEKFDLGMACYDFKRYGQAAFFLSRIETSYSDNILTQRLLFSYYYSGQEDEALNLCQKVRKDNGIVRLTAEFEAQFYEYIGDFDKALEVYTQILEETPDDIDIKMSVALICFSQGRFDKVDEILAERPTIQKTTKFETGVNFAYLLKERGHLEDAIEVFYELRRYNFNDYQAHLKYISLFLEQSESILKLPIISQIDCASLNTAINIQNKNNLEEWYILDERLDADIRFKELPLTHALAKEVMGKTQGEALSNGKVLKNIISKYLYAYQESLERYKEFFPDEKHIEQVELPSIQEENSSLDSLKPLLDRVDKYDDQVKRLERFYKNEQLPVGALAEFTGVNPIKVWAGLLRKSNINLIATMGTEDERLSASKHLKHKDITLVLDIIALLTIHELELQDKVKSTYKNLIVSWSTIKTILDYLIECRSTLNTGYLTIRKEDSSYVKYEIKPEHLQAQYNFLTTMYEWTLQNCEIKAVHELLTLNRFERDKARKLIGAGFFDSLLLATRENHLLYSDDERLRRLAGHEYQAQGVWTQAIISDLNEKKAVNNSEYFKYVIRLVELGYDYVSINWICLLECLKQSTDWSCGGTFTELLSIILSNRTTLDSSLIVLTDFYVELWKENIPIELKESILKHTIVCLLRNSKSYTTKAIEDSFSHLLQRKFKLQHSMSKQAVILGMVKALIILKLQNVEFTRVQILNLIESWGLSE